MTRYRINPGEFRHIITIQENKTPKNTFGEKGKGGKGDQWEDLLTTRAGIYPISGKEYLSANKENGEISHKIEMRYVPNIDIKSDMRIKFGTRIFELITPPINFQEKNIKLQFLCREVF